MTMDRWRMWVLIWSSKPQAIWDSPPLWIWITALIRTDARLTCLFHSKLLIAFVAMKSRVGVSYPQRVLRDGRRISAYDAYLPPVWILFLAIHLLTVSLKYVLNARSNLFLQSGARVLKVLIDDDLNAYGVSYLINGTIFEVNWCHIRRAPSSR